ncbi:hypothetical protein HELRODRAFT_181479 [Helobdella robusta]|uniref:Uncharacterized protein n=1 Tax=Helobdella robusta TaxID=6412 RepID=T1FH15_HELRO|nr:hypothetical protein HELRODRAFT_181479 [Helobdella robusta]ESN92428.1 hypothetical protein HELRODRAFT_181479 [Helobdella robusta]
MYTYKYNDDEFEPLLKAKVGLSDGSFDNDDDDVIMMKKKFLHYKKCLLKEINDVTTRSDDVRINLTSVGISHIDEKLNEYAALYNDHLERWDRILDRVTSFKNNNNNYNNNKNKNNNKVCSRNDDGGTGADNDIADDDDVDKADDDDDDCKNNNNNNNFGGNIGQKMLSFWSRKDRMKDEKGKRIVKFVKTYKEALEDFIMLIANDIDNKVRKYRTQQRNKTLQNLIKTFNKVNTELSQLIERTPSLVRLLKSISGKTTQQQQQQQLHQQLKRQHQQQQLQTSPEKSLSYDKVEKFIDDDDDDVVEVEADAIGGLTSRVRSKVTQQENNKMYNYKKLVVLDIDVLDDDDDDDDDDDEDYEGYDDAYDNSIDISIAAATAATTTTTNNNNNNKMVEDAVTSQPTSPYFSTLSSLSSPRPLSPTSLPQPPQPPQQPQPPQPSSSSQPQQTSSAAVATKNKNDNLLKSLCNDSFVKVGGPMMGSVRADLEKFILNAGLSEKAELKAINQLKSNLGKSLTAFY